MADDGHGKTELKYRKQKDITMETDTVTIDQFVTGNNITMTAKRVDSNPHMDGSDKMDNWKCTLIHEYTEPGTFANLQTGKVTTGKKHAARMTLHFSKGTGHHGAEPTASEVLDCLASDASGLENAPEFQDWCSEYGYDSDSRKAEKIYRTVEHQAARLKTFLGADLYDTLLWHTERA